MRTYSAWVPSIRWPRIQPPSSQWEYICFLQYSHFPQEVTQEMMTLSPFLKLLTPSPTSYTLPPPSWPSTRPLVTAGTSTLRMCKSVPQMVVLVILTMASVDLEIIGLATDSQTFCPGPW